MKRLWVLLAFLLYGTITYSQVPVTVTGTITDAGGNPAVSGYVQFDIQPKGGAIQYFVSGVGSIAPQSTQCGINSNGQLTSLAVSANPCKVWGNDVITPGNTTYKVSFAPGGNITNVVTGECLSGSTYNLNTPVFCPVIQVNPQQGVIRTNPFATNIIPVVNGSFNLGSTSFQWGSIYAINLFLNGQLFSPTNIPFLSAINTYTGVNIFTNGIVANTIGDTGLTPGNCVQAVTVSGIPTLTTSSGPCGTTSGTVTTTGSPFAGTLASFSSSLSITNTDLTGDVTTSGSVATTLASTLAGAKTWSGLATFGSGITGTGSIGTLTVPVGNITPGINGQCNITSGTTAVWGSCAGTAGEQFLSINTTASTTNGATTAYQTVQTASAPIAAGALNFIGKTVRITMYGSFNPVSAPQTLRLGFSIGPANPFTFANFSAASSGTNFFWKMTVTCTTTTTGTSGVLTCVTDVIVTQPIATSPSSQVVISVPAVTILNGVNLTAAQTPFNGISFGISSSSNTATGYNFLVEQLN